MKARNFVMMGIALLMIGALLAGAVQTLDAQPAPLATRPALENVRHYAPAVDAAAPNYAVDGGLLFAGGPGGWIQMRTPKGIIVGAAATDSNRPDVVYMGAANELTLFRSADGGESWLRVPLSNEAGGVTDIAVDGKQRLVYAGTDTAGVFRLRDVGSSILVGGQLLLDEPVRQVAADATGAGLAFARTDRALYRADNAGLAWSTVDGLLSMPTTIAIANTDPARVYVGTTDRGVLESLDGHTWTMANEGLGITDGMRLHVDALAADPLQPGRLYAATSSVYGSDSARNTSSRVAMSTDAAASWHALDRQIATSVAELMPVGGAPGAVYALTTRSRTPIALYDEADLPLYAASLAQADAGSPARLSYAADTQTLPIAWAIAALAALALGIIATYDVHQRGVRPMTHAVQHTPLDTQTLPTVG